MKERTRTKLIQEGKYVAEVEVVFMETDDGWSPSLSLDEAYKLDKVRESLRQGDIKTALGFGPVFTLTPVSS